MGNEPMDEIMTTSPSQLMRRAVAERDAEIRAWLEREIDGITRLGDDYDQGTRYGLERALAWIGDTDG